MLEISYEMDECDAYHRGKQVKLPFQKRSNMESLWKTTTRTY